MPEANAAPKPLPARAVLPLAVLGIAAISAVDYLAGVEVRTYPLYYLPISVLAWYEGRPGAVVGTLLCAAAWLTSNLLAGLAYSGGAWILLVNTVVQGVSFLVVGLLIAAFEAALTRERGLSRTDPLTRLFNTRAFYEEADRILALCRRNERPATVAYLDLDNFKSVNDRKGHEAGDALLREVADVLRASTRPSDVPARLGGDEFVLLLPELAPAEASAALDRLRSLLVDSPTLRSSDVTATIGGVTFLRVPEELEEVVRRADERMYAAKAAGKNRVDVTVAES